jgi:hypothetical protein
MFLNARMECFRLLLRLRRSAQNGIDPAEHSEAG